MSSWLRHCPFSPCRGHTGMQSAADTAVEVRQEGLQRLRVQSQGFLLQSCSFLKKKKGGGGRLDMASQSVSSCQLGHTLKKSFCLHFIKHVTTKILSLLVFGQWETEINPREGSRMIRESDHLHQWNPWRLIKLWRSNKEGYFRSGTRKILRAQFSREGTDDLGRNIGTRHHELRLQFSSPAAREH